LKGETKLGTRVEVKNLNSIRNVKKAIEFEINRLIGLVEAGNPIQQQTRSFDASNDTTFAIRDKEEANDYRYFPDPDLAPFHLTDKYINSIKETLPELPDALAARYKSSYGLSEYDAGQLCDTRSTADYFEAVIAYCKHYKAIANWMLGPLRQYLNEQQIDFAALTLEPAKLAAVIELVEDGKVSFSVASSKLLPIVLETDENPLTLAESMNLIQVHDQHAIEKWVNEAMEAMPEKVAEYRKGKKGLIGLFVGEVKKRSQGKADPKQVTSLLEQKLNQ
jgi:aspartyl-tRNA(Asn)/glutamyl-tRNA(Gln) amidotransferase subunit B